jgi:SsrA-binding protein
MAESKTSIKIVSENRKARHDYKVDRTIECGLVLVGSEVKSLRQGKIQLVDSYALFEKGELWLHKAHIAEYAQGGPFFNHPPVRKRKLLLKSRELADLGAAIDRDGMALVPLKVYFKNGRAKLELGICKGKTKGDKRETAKTRDTHRQMDIARRRSR